MTTRGTENMNEDKHLDKSAYAKRYGLSKKAVDTACSRNPSSLAPFFKMGKSKNSPIRFRLEDCIEFEREMLNKQVDELKAKQRDAQQLLIDLGEL